MKINDLISDSMEFISDSTIRETELIRDNPLKKRSKRKWFAAAACLILILCTSVSVEATTGGISNLLAPLFGGARVPIVDNIGKPVGAAVSVSGYTLTADAIIGDRYNFAVVYTLSRDDGEPIPDGASFDFWSASIRLGGASAGTIKYIQDEDDLSKLRIVESWSSSILLIGRITTVSFSDLSIPSDSGERVIAEGEWELTYTLRYGDTSVKVPVDSLTVKDEYGSEYVINRILISPIGIHMDVTAPAISVDEIRNDVSARVMQHFSVSIQLKDGTIVPLEASKGGSYADGDKTAKAHYASMYNMPINPVDIESLIICDTVYIIDMDF